MTEKLLSGSKPDPKEAASAAVRPSVLLSVLAIICMMLAMFPAPPAAAAPDASDNIISFKGEFVLRQEDGANCSFSGAPDTRGTIDLAVFSDREYGRIDMEGSGEDTRRGLKCGDVVGDMHWTTAYTIAAEGAAKIDGDDFVWIGLLEGMGTVTWSNCEDDGEPITCPSVPPSDYQFGVIVKGTLSCTSGGAGSILVQGINLNTSGSWVTNQAPPEGIYLRANSGHAALNDVDMLNGCLLPVKVGDKVVADKSADVTMICQSKIGEAEQFVSTTLAHLHGTADNVMLYSILLRHQECEARSRARHQSAGEQESAIGIDLLSGSASFVVPSPTLGLLVQAPAAQAKSSGGAHLIIHNTPGGEQSKISSLGGLVEVTPANDALGPVTIGYAQQVTVTDAQVSPITNLELTNLPFITAGGP